MLAAGLQKGTFDPAPALAHLTPEVMAEHLSPPLVWKCIAEMVTKTFLIDDGQSDTLEKAAASMSAAKLEAMVVRQSPIVSRPLSDADSWDGANAISEEEVLEETSPGELPPSPPAASTKKKPAPAPVASAAKR